MKRERKLSPYAQQLFDSGRGEELLRQFYFKLILLSKVPDYKVTRLLTYAKHRDKERKEDGA